MHNQRVFLPLATLILSAIVSAQTDFATIRGVAVDPSGASVPAAKIEIVNANTSLTRETVTTGGGEYEIPYLPAGTYRLTAAGPGFKTFVADNLLLSARETRRLDLTLELGEVGSTVEVTANAAVIETEGSQVAAGFTSRKFRDSPNSIGFFPQAFMTSLPGVQAQGGGFTLRIAGQPSSQIVEALDGVPSDGPVNLVQNMNDFEELQVVGANNSAEFSRVTNFSMSGKSGTNAFHGSAFYDFTSSALAARSFFDAKKPASHQHRSGLSVSGPIIRNRTFFYAAYYYSRVPGSAVYNRTVPPLAFRQGDFSQLSAAIKDPLTGQAFPGNIIPANRLNPLSLKVQNSYIPQPNQGPANSLSNNYGFNFPWPSDLFKWNSTTDRIDHRFSEKNTIFGRYTNRITPYVLAGAFPDLGTWTRYRYHHSVVVSDTHIFSPTLVNTARWGWIKDYINDGDTISGVTPVKADAVVKDIGLLGVNPRGYSAMGFPQMDITGFQRLDVQPGGVNTNARNYDYADSMTWNFGSHVLKFGGELRTFRTFNGTIPVGTYGQFAFNGTLSGNAYADFLLGMPFSSTRLNPLTERAQRSYELGMFITDTFKVTRKLTLDYGLRWDYFGPSTYRDGLQYNWDPSTNSIVVPESKLNSISPLYPTGQIKVIGGQVVPNPDKKNYRPRLGVAYLINDKTVVRGGYGMYTETLGNFAALQGTGPFQLSETFFNTVQNGQALFSFPNPFPTAPGTVPSQSAGGYPLQIENGLIHQFNFTVERQIHDVGVRLSYIGSRSNGLHYTLSTNKPQPSLTPFTASRRPYQQFVSTTFLQQDGKAKYDSVQIELRRKVGFLVVNGHYTLANNFGDYFNLENPYDHHFWNRDQYTSRHRAVINSVVDLPFGRGRRFMTNAPAPVDFALGGWRMTWITVLQSGQYFTPTFTGSDPSNTNSSGGIPDRVGEGNLPSDQRTVARWFDPAAFTVPQPGRFGNSGVNILEGPGISQQNLAVTKEFKASERFRVEFQTLILDLFNSPTFNFPANNISVPGQVGRLNAVLAQGDPGNATTVSNRFITMRLRLIF
jgi:hypothetical protein